jgi:hypothetical protein
MRTFADKNGRADFLTVDQADRWSGSNNDTGCQECSALFLIFRATRRAFDQQNRCLPPPSAGRSFFLIYASAANTFGPVREAGLKPRIVTFDAP